MEKLARKCYKMKIGLLFFINNKKNLQKYEK